MAAKVLILFLLQLRLLEVVAVLVAVQQPLEVLEVEGPVAVPSQAA
jgi:hypothetical protein